MPPAGDDARRHPPGSTGRCAGPSSPWSRTTRASSTSGSGSTTSAARTRDAVCLSAGGCVAYYPTEVPFHHRSAWLGERDVVRRAGRRLPQARHGRASPAPIRTRPTTTCRRAHPDWIAVDADGKPRRHWASPEMWVTCGLGPYNFEFMTEVKRGDHDPLPGRRHLHQPLGRLRHVLLRALPGATSGPRPATSCRARTTRRTRAARATSLWQQQRLFELWRLWDAEVRKINPDSCVIPNTGGGATSSLDMKRIGELAPDAVRRPPGAQRPHAARGPTA